MRLMTIALAFWCAALALALVSEVKRGESFTGNLIREFIEMDRDQ